MKIRTYGLSILVAAAVAVFCVGTADAGSFGAGIHYLRTLGDISEDDAIDLKQDSF